MALLFCLALAGSAAAAAAATTAAVHIETAKLLSQTSPGYKCWNIDASRNRGFQWRNLSSPSLLQLAAGLPAGYLRFGGSGNDALWYGDGINGENGCAGAQPRHFNCLNATMVDGLLALARAAQAQLVFGLNLDNAGLGLHWNGSSSWNSTNAEGMVRYLAARGQPYAFELGNEDNSHYPAEGLSPEQEARGFAKLVEILIEAYPDEETRPKIIGPDADYQDSKPAQAKIYRGWGEAFLGNVSKYKVPLAAATLHEYIEVGWNGSSWTSLDPDVLDRTATCADDWRDMVQRTSQRVGLGLPEVWAGEIGPHNGGSPPCNHSSMRWANFANSFWYMDAMGTKAAHGFSVFCRQDFIGADYGLLDCETQTPLPDYYTSRLWSQLMGAGVLQATVPSGEPRTLRAYAHCAADSPRDIVVLLLNLGGQPLSVAVSPAAEPTAAAAAARTEWHFTAGAGSKGGLGGTAVRLNGSELKWQGPGHPLPAMPGVPQAAADVPVKLAPQSIAFVRLPGAAPDGLCPGSAPAADGAATMATTPVL